MPKVLVTFDLKDADGDDRELGYTALLQVGLSRLAKPEGIRLPHTSVLGITNVAEHAAAIRNELVKILENATGKEVTRLIVAVVGDVAGIGETDPDLAFQEAFTRLYLG